VTVSKRSTAMAGKKRSFWCCVAGNAKCQPWVCEVTLLSCLHSPYILYLGCIIFWLVFVIIPDGISYCKIYICMQIAACYFNTVFQFIKPHFECYLNKHEIKIKWKWDCDSVRFGMYTHTVSHEFWISVNFPVDPLRKINGTLVNSYNAYLPKEI
jgi:hypothetical protein